MAQMKKFGKRRGGPLPPRPPPAWDEADAYEELRYWDSLIQEGVELHPRDYDRYEELRYWYDCLWYEEDMRQYNNYVDWFREWEQVQMAPEPEQRFPVAPLPQEPQRAFVNDDRYIMSKHSAVYPTPKQLQAVQSMVSDLERALKAVSESLRNKEPSETASSKVEGKLRGVYRVGQVGKGLLLKDDLDLDLVLLSRDMPTSSLLRLISGKLTELMKDVTKETYVITPSVQEAAVIVTNTKAPLLKLTIHLTSPVVSEQVEKETSEESCAESSPPDVLDRQKCLAALRSLRQTKWFQGEVTIVESCVIVIRILRDLCSRVPTFAPLKDWVIEVLCEKVSSTCDRPMGPGETLRRFLECLASGFLMEDTAGLHDPCEKELTDAAAHLTPQQREDITQSAQFALRLAAFGQLYKVLGMNRFGASHQNRGVEVPFKRPREASDGGECEENIMIPNKVAKTEPPNALMKLNQICPGLSYVCTSQTGPVHEPLFTMAVEVCGKTYEGTGSSKRSAKLNVAE
ncbi:hypothetical protein DNTS_029774, partial [Danionella cerebrum]